MSKDMLGPLTRALVGVSTRRLGLVLDIANRLGSSADSDVFFLDLARFVRDHKKAVTKTAKKTVILRRLYEAETITVGATDGTETFAGSRVFLGGVYGLTLPKKGSQPTAATDATIHEMVANGNFAQIFGSLGENRRLWIEAAVVSFCRDHPGKLRTGGYATFFELEGGFVAYVYVYDGGRLYVRVRPLEYDSVWYARYQHRIVVPL